MIAFFSLFKRLISSVSGAISRHDSYVHLFSIGTCRTFTSNRRSRSASASIMSAMAVMRDWSPAGPPPGAFRNANRHSRPARRRRPFA